MNARIVLLSLLFGIVIVASPPLAELRQRPPEAPLSVKFDLPDSVEMQERAGLIVTGAFVGSRTPLWIAEPSGEWIEVLLRDSDGKLLLDRHLWPYAPGRQPFVSPIAVYGKLTYPFEVLARCEPLRSGRYSMEIHYESPGKDQALAVSQTSSVALTVRSDRAVPMRHLSLEVPDRVLHDDFRIPQFGLNVRVLNDGCEMQSIVPFAPESVTVRARASDGRNVSCQPATARAALATVPVQPMQSWQTFVPFSGRCDIPLPTGASQRTRYRIQVSYRGPGWTDAPLQLDRTIELELANLPHSSTPVPGPRPTPRAPGA